MLSTEEPAAEIKPEPAENPLDQIKTADDLCAYLKTIQPNLSENQMNYLKGNGSAESFFSNSSKYLPTIVKTETFLYRNIAALNTKSYEVADIKEMFANLKAPITDEGAVRLAKGILLGIYPANFSERAAKKTGNVVNSVGDMANSALTSTQQFTGIDANAKNPDSNVSEVEDQITPVFLVTEGFVENGVKSLISAGTQYTRYEFYCANMDCSTLKAFNPEVTATPEDVYKKLMKDISGVPTEKLPEKLYLFKMIGDTRGGKRRRTIKKKKRKGSKAKKSKSSKKSNKSRK